MKTNGRRNRSAGHNWEREGVKDFSLFYPNVQTSRLVSRARDNEKVDLAHADELKDGRFPYNCQYKSYSKALPYYQILSEMPTTPGVPNVIMHKQTQKSKSGKKFVTLDKFAIMTAEDFFKFVAWRRGYEITAAFVTKNDNSLAAREELVKQLKDIGL